MKQVLSSVVSNVEVMPGVYLIWLNSPQIASLSRPGQFVMVRCGEDTLLRRPLSIHRVDETKTRLALLFAIVGRGSRWLSRRQEGDTVDLLGPLGNGFFIHPDAKKLLLVAGGIGIAPLSFLAEQAQAQDYNIKLLMGASSSAQLLRTQGLPSWVILGLGITIMKATDDGSEGFKGLATDLIAGHVDWADQIFACGPMPMYKTMAQMPALKNKPVQISLEIMMGCGRGLCYGCTIKTKYGLKKVCADGPVFDLDDILWDELGSF